MQLIALAPLQPSPDDWDSELKIDVFKTENINPVAIRVLNPIAAYL